MPFGVLIPAPQGAVVPLMVAVTFSQQISLMFWAVKTVMGPLPV